MEIRIEQGERVTDDVWPVVELDVVVEIKHDMCLFACAVFDEETGTQPRLARFNLAEEDPVVVRQENTVAVHAIKRGVELLFWVGREFVERGEMFLVFKFSHGG